MKGRPGNDLLAMDYGLTGLASTIRPPFGATPPWHVSRLILISCGGDGPLADHPQLDRRQHGDNQTNNHVGVVDPDRA
jgi:hypothetical protein